MPKQKELNTSIKDFVSVMDKQIGKLKNVDPKHALKESTNKDNKDNMIKEANENPKPKTPKPQNNRKMALHNMRINQNCLPINKMQQK